MKTIVITGTSRGIGYEVVKYYASKGHTIIALSRNCKPIDDLGLKNCKALAFDISNASDFEKVKLYFKEHVQNIDILINNAGYLVNKPFNTLTSQDFLQSYQVNVLGAAELIQACLPYMKSDGHVVNISSMGGIQGSMKFPGLAAYSSSKGAILTLTELLAEEYKENGPSFNALALGAVQTEMLAEAFPGYEAPLTAVQMAEYIANFALTGNTFYNGKILEVSSSTP